MCTSGTGKPIKPQINLSVTFIRVLKCVTCLGPEFIPCELWWCVPVEAIRFGDKTSLLSQERSLLKQGVLNRFPLIPVPR